MRTADSSRNVRPPSIGPRLLRPIRRLRRLKRPGSLTIPRIGPNLRGDPSLPATVRADRAERPVPEAPAGIVRADRVVRVVREAPASAPGKSLNA